jgi:hypothetical protein
MTLPLPGQRGLPKIADDVPEEWEAALDTQLDPVEPEYAIIMCVVEQTRLAEIRPKFIEFLEGLHPGTRVAIAHFVANGERQEI